MTQPTPRITLFLDWLQRERGLEFPSYEALWQWSVTDLEGFWGAVWAFFDLQSPTPFTRVLDASRMPGARWFDGAQVNYAQQALRHTQAADADGHPAIVFQNERMTAPATLA